MILSILSPSLFFAERKNLLLRLVLQILCMLDRGIGWRQRLAFFRWIITCNLVLRHFQLI